MTEPAFALPAEPPPPPSVGPVAAPWTSGVWEDVYGWYEHPDHDHDHDHDHDEATDPQTREDATRLLQAVLAVILTAVAMTVGWSVAGPIGLTAGCVVLTASGAGVVMLHHRVAAALSARRLRRQGGLLEYQWQGAVCEPLPVDELAALLADGRLAASTPVRSPGGAWSSLGEVVRLRSLGYRPDR